MGKVIVKAISSVIICVSGVYVLDALNKLTRETYKFSKVCRILRRIK